MPTPSTERGSDFGVMSRACISWTRSGPTHAMPAISQGPGVTRQPLIFASATKESEVQRFEADDISFLRVSRHLSSVSVRN
jgi:hypothetical protein